MLPWRATPAVVALIAIIAACRGGRGATVVQRSTTLAPASRPALTISERTEAFVDSNRPTAAVGTTPASATRSLPTLVVAPAPGQPGRPYPLIVFAHGNGATSRSKVLLLRAWAAAGYVVAAPTFPFGAGRALSLDEGANDYPNQPADITFVITQMLRLNQDPASSVRGTIDPNRIGAAGHSLGAATTLALAGNTCCHDDRVKAAVVLAGWELRFPSGDFWLRIATPILFVHGDADTFVSYRSGVEAFQDAPPPKFLVTIVGGSHTVPYQDNPGDRQAEVITAASLDFFDHYLKGLSHDLTRMQSDASVAGVAEVRLCTNGGNPGCRP
ncbi:MAG: dienelactone hydrolase family protein [Actinomycetota bacterium]|nr:dienelactone hydrolase family protein [Actinomycetota bacterium]